MIPEHDYCAKRISAEGDLNGNKVEVEFWGLDWIYMKELFPFDPAYCGSAIHFRAENIRAVIAALEEMADWLEESPEEEVVRI